MHKYFSWFGLPGKVVLTSLLSILAIGLWVADPSRSRLLCAAAMVVSSLGDLAMMEEMQKRKKCSAIPPFYVGAALFMVAHVLYIRAYWEELAANGITWPNAGTYVGVCLLLVGCVSVLAFLIRSGKPGAVMLLGSLVYLLVISANCTVISTYAAGMGGIRYLCAAGALSFFISDYLIGARMLSDIPFFQGEGARGAVWWFYPIGQALMIIFLR